MDNAIFLAFDDKHWHYFIHLYNSLQENYPDHPTLLVHYNGWDYFKTSWLSKRPDIRLYSSTKLPIDLISHWYHDAVPSKMVYYKYLLWTEDYDEFDNILHIDADTLILSPLDELFEKNEFFVIKNNIPFKEVRILPESKTYNDIRDKKLQKHDIRLPEHDDMINAGVFVIPRKYRTMDHLKTLIDITNDFGHLLVYADQSALSLWCMKNDITPNEDYQYNFQIPLFDKFFKPRYKSIGSYLSLKKDILNKIKIVHFSGPIKPNYEKFRTWRLMGRYANIFLNCYRKYEGVPR
jgi:lipopolysaccharide biosynthesis glycosyltransferase